MDIKYLCNQWQDYKSRPINMNVHPQDVMFTSAVKVEDYTYVGEAAINSIFSVMAAAPTMDVKRIMDFGCGHGRVGRHLRAFFAGAEITFTDVDQSCVDFCAAQFGGKGVVTPKDFSQLDLPKGFDLIWLGSVWTHMDYERMEVLFDALFDCLNPRGVVMGTFRGNKMYQTYMADPEMAARDADLLRQYEETGTGYRRYPGWEDDWGLSLVSPQKLMSMGQRHPEARLVGYTEVGWAGAHDVVAWTNVSPGTKIR